MGKGFMVKGKEPAEPALVVYNEGVEMPGGTHFYSGYSGIFGGSCVENATNVVMVIPNGTRRFYGSTNKIDVTKYTMAYANVVLNHSSSSTSQTALFLTTSSTLTNMDAAGTVAASNSVSGPSLTGEHTFEINIASIFGEFFVCISMAHATNVTIKKIWLEV